jgi:hypothetical protein
MLAVVHNLLAYVDRKAHLTERKKQEEGEKVE